MIIEYQKYRESLMMGTVTLRGGVREGVPEEKAIRAWHFLGEGGTVRHVEGVMTVLPGEVLTVQPPLALCYVGLHGSTSYHDAMRFAPITGVPCRTLHWGEVLHDTDKLCSEHRKVLYMLDSEESLKRAIDALLFALKDGNPAITESDVSKLFISGLLGGRKVYPFMKNEEYLMKLYDNGVISYVEYANYYNRNASFQYLFEYIRKPESQREYSLSEFEVVYFSLTKYKFLTEEQADEIIMKALKVMKAQKEYAS